jgi:hypothetical protein
MCPQTPRLSPEYSHKAGLQTVITETLLQIWPVTRSGHAGPVTIGRITRGPPCWTRPHGGRMTSSRVFVRCRMGRRVYLPVVLSPLGQRLRRRSRAKGGVFAFAPIETMKVFNMVASQPHWKISKTSSSSWRSSEAGSRHCRGPADDVRRGPQQGRLHGRGDIPYQCKSHPG